MKTQFFSYNKLKNILNGYLCGMADIFYFLLTYIWDEMKFKHTIARLFQTNPLTDLTWVSLDFIRQDLLNGTNLRPVSGLVPKLELRMCMRESHQNLPI